MAPAIASNIGRQDGGLESNADQPAKQDIEQFDHSVTTRRSLPLANRLSSVIDKL